MSTGTREAGLIRPVLSRLQRWTSVACRGFAQDLLFPPRCARCDDDLFDAQDDVQLCGDCRDLLGPETWIGCRRCGATTPAELPPPDSCGWCNTMGLRFDRTVVLGSYRDELREAVLKMKNAAREQLAKAVGQLFCHLRGGDLAQFQADLVVPVPMHWARRLVRGVNSPDTLAACVARHLRVRSVERIVFCSRKTLPQASLRRGKRLQNVRGAFGLRAGYDLRGVRVVLVDDVLTTGATASEIAKVLKEAGASIVSVAILTRAEGRGHS